MKYLKYIGLGLLVLMVLFLLVSGIIWIICNYPITLFYLFIGGVTLWFAYDIGKSIIE
jgi:hypothetical protein